MSALVTVHGQTMELTAPRRLVERYDLAAASAEHGHAEQTARRVVAAALGLCWEAGPRKAGWPAYRGDVLAYGGDVLEYLLAAGSPMHEIVSAGTTALRLVVESMPRPEQIETARGNSAGAGVGPSSAPSGSPVGTGATPTG